MDNIATPKLEEVFGTTSLNLILKNLMKTRKVSPEDQVTYEPVETELSGVRYIIKAEHIFVEEIIKYGSSNCNKCNGKGYRIVHLEKRKIPNPQDYVILSDRNIETMSEEEKKIWVEMEKKKTTWKLMLPCICAIRKMAKREGAIFSNPTGNIVARLSYEIAENK
jgi:hypothetical protein